VAVSIESSSLRVSSGVSTGVLTFFLGVRRSADDGCLVGRDHLAQHQPIEEHLDSGQVLLDGRPRTALRKLLNVGRHVDGFDPAQLSDPVRLAPVGKA
jgi:hypothetical protein